MAEAMQDRPPGLLTYQEAARKLSELVGEHVDGGTVEWLIRKCAAPVQTTKVTVTRVSRVRASALPEHDLTALAECYRANAHRRRRRVDAR